MKGMKCIIVTALFVVILAQSALSVGNEKNTEKPPRKDGINILLILPHNYGANYYLNRDVFEQYGWKVTTAGLTKIVQPCPPFAQAKNAPPLKVDTLLSSINDITVYDCIAIMPATQWAPEQPFADIIGDVHAMELIRSAAEKGIPLSTICSGVRVFASAGLIKGKKVVGSPKFQAEYTAAGATFLGNDHPPVNEGGIITGVRDMYYSAQNCDLIAQAIEAKKSGGGRGPLPDKPFIGKKGNSFTADDVQWIRTFGGNGSDGIKSVFAAGDGGIVSAGYTFSHGSGEPDIFILKTGANGEKEWEQTVGGCGFEYANSLIEVSDGYILTGYTTSFKALKRDVLLVKLDKNGDVQWKRGYGGTDIDAGCSVFSQSDGYLITGYTSTSGNGEEDIYLLKTDFEGNELWSKTYGGNRQERGSSVYQDGNSLVIGSTTGTFGNGNCDFYLVKTDLSGKETFSKAFHATITKGHGFDWCSMALKGPEGSVFLTGYSDCNDLMDACVLKIDGTGNLQWENAFGEHSFYDYASDAVLTPDGGIAVFGTTKRIHENSYDNDLYMVKLNAAGKVEWSKTLGSSGNEWGFSCCVDATGSLVLAGQTQDVKTGYYDAVLIKISIK